MVKKLLAFAGSIVSLLVATTYVVVGLAAWADAQEVCPDSNQCSDARSAMWFSAIVVLVSFVVCAVTIRILSRPHGAEGDI
jgi:hypothetical protein